MCDRLTCWDPQDTIWREITLVSSVQQEVVITTGSAWKTFIHSLSSPADHSLPRLISLTLKIISKMLCRFISVWFGIYRTRSHLPGEPPSRGRDCWRCNLALWPLQYSVILMLVSYGFLSNYCLPFQAEDRLVKMPRCSWKTHRLV